MTRGRPSLTAITLAAGIDAKRGVVIFIDLSKKSPFDPYIIHSTDIVAAKVKRTRSHIWRQRDIALRFKSEIAENRSHLRPSSGAARVLDTVLVGNLAVLPSYGGLDYRGTLIWGIPQVLFAGSGKV
ncbi:MAG: hypothetical protein WCF90_10190 [Methanomicrobiales archaeon]